MVTQDTRQMQADLAMQGWGAQTVGFDDHMIPMYLHREHPGRPDKKVGDVFMFMRVGDPRNIPKSLDPSETQQMDRYNKKIGVFAWQIGEECLKRPFTPTATVVNDRGENVQVRGETQMGCKPCRDREAARLSGLTAGSTEAGESNDSNVAREPLTTTGEVVQPETTNGITCDVCGYVPKQQTKAGKPTSQKQQENALRLHSKQH